MRKVLEGKELSCRWLRESEEDTPTPQAFVRISKERGYGRRVLYECEKKGVMNSGLARAEEEGEIPVKVGSNDSNGDRLHSSV